MESGISMPVGSLVDGKHRPTAHDISSVLGSRAILYKDLCESIATDYGIKGELEFGGPKYGWVLEYRKGGRPLAALYPANKKLIVQIVLGRNAVEEAAKLDLGRNVRAVYDNARQLYDGRWLFVPVTSKRDLEDVKRLIRIKAETKKR